MTVLSFHPIFEADRNLLCAGRKPGKEELAAIRSARAVILPQGCPHALYVMAKANCPYVFPNYEARFQYPGKIGQSRLFQNMGAPHPQTETFDGVDTFARKSAHGKYGSVQVPNVFKFDWGGEGETVFLVESTVDLGRMLDQARAFEATGQRGFLLQELISTGGRVLRVAVIGNRRVSYWRTDGGKGRFAVNLAGGAVIDNGQDPQLMAEAEAAVENLCRQTGINLAGFDLLFRIDSPEPIPLFLEINYFFGRRGLGGSEAYYRLLTAEIENWLVSIGITT